MRILFSIPNFITAGSGREMFNIIERLDINKFEVIICVEKSDPHSPLENEIRSKGFQVIEYKTRHQRKFNLRSFFYAVYYFRKLRIDIWQSFDWSSDFVEPILAGLAGAKYGFVKKSMNWNRIAWRIKAFCSKYIVARNTTLLKGHLKPFYFRKKTFYITGGVDYEKFSPRKDDHLIYRTSSLRGVFLICCVAQVIPVKGQGILLEAFSKCPENFVLWLVGSTLHESYYKELKDFTDRNLLSSRVKFWGSVNDVHKILQEVDLYVLPTSMYGGHEEGCPVSLLEAMAVQVPCIATDVAGSRDLIDNEVNGLLVPPDNAKALENAIIYAYENYELMSLYAQSARMKVVTNHGVQAEADKFSNMYCDVV